MPFNYADPRAEVLRKTITTYLGHYRGLLPLAVMPDDVRAATHTLINAIDNWTVQARGEAMLRADRERVQS